MDILDNKQLAMAFDCEGSFIVQEQATALNLGLSIAQSYCNELLYAIQTSMNCGKVYEGHWWEVRGKADILTAIELIEPYLIVTREPMKVFKELVGTLSGIGHRIEDRQLVYRQKLLEAWNANFTQKAKSLRRNNLAEHDRAIGDLQRVSTGQVTQP